MKRLMFSPILVLLGLITCSKYIVEVEYGAIQVNSTPTGAEVFLDESPTGLKTNCRLLDVAEGQHSVTLKLEGYEDRNLTVTVTGNDTLTVDAELYLKGELKWKVQLGSTSLTSPAIGYDGTIYVGSNDNHLYAINPDGSQKWRYKTEQSVPTSPAIGSDGTIYIASGKELYAVNPDGTPRWINQYEFALTYPPAISSDGTLYFWIDNYSPNIDTIYALNPDGSVKWTYTLPVGGQISSPTVIGSDGSIYIGTYNYVYALHPESDYRFKWVYKTSCTISSPPAISNEGHLYVISQEGTLYALLSIGKTLWSRNIFDWNSKSSPVIGQDGTVYVGGSWFDWDGEHEFKERDIVVAMSPTGDREWSVNFRTATPAIGSDGTVYLAGNGLYALNPNGSVRWVYRTESGVSSPAIGDDGSVYVGSSDGYLYAIETESQGLADSPWPKYMHDNQNTGRAD